VCIVETPQESLVPSLPTPLSQLLIQTTIDRDEPILSDLPNLLFTT